MSEKDFCPSEPEVSENLCPDGGIDRLPAEEEKEYVPVGNYDRVLYAVYKNGSATKALNIVSKLSVLISILTFLSCLVCFSVTDWRVTAELAAVTAVPFVLVSVFRKILNAKRPYEVFSFYRTAPKKKRGQSFPSRHVFSIFVIGTALCFINLPIGLILMVMGAALAAARVLLGIHYVKDVLAGAIIGVVFGIGGMLIASALF